ncbi:N-acetyltransferase [Spongiactinospora gelatinilytica]|uniref:N-acetyltransferase n=1 Tax=Spongiactinospora gelatinilytica TaxID=2666298 RepID=A0A2W2F8N2_9ACTN|nr:GNAT family N-acetyltransferase [Spongiactinospora gelatinilytica]PZG25889.1 N-acetyltransferase [Spongiactinospora gelatinilytica]
MPDPLIRPAIYTDLTPLIRYFGQADFFFERFHRQRRGRGMLLIALRGGDVVGNVYLWWEPAEELELRERLPGVPVITHLEVRADRRNQGVGTALLAEAEHILAQRGHRHVALGVSLTNPDAHRLYARLNYVEWGHPPVRMPGETFQILVKPLARPCPTGRPDLR